MAAPVPSRRRVYAGPPAARPPDVKGRAPAAGPRRWPPPLAPAAGPRRWPPPLAPPSGPESRWFQRRLIIAINTQFPGLTTQRPWPHRRRPTGTELRSHVPEVDAGKPDDDGALPRRIDAVVAAAEVEARPGPANEARAREEPQLAADRWPADPERGRDIGGAVHCAGDQGNDPSPCRICQQLDALCQSSRHGCPFSGAGDLPSGRFAERAICRAGDLRRPRRPQDPAGEHPRLPIGALLPLTCRRAVRHVIALVLLTWNQLDS
jgi:hypothetical protein